MNVRDIPGTEYEIAANFSLMEMPEDSPFRVPWWYRGWGKGCSLGPSSLVYEVV